MSSLYDSKHEMVPQALWIEPASEISNKPLPPSPRSAPTMIFERQNRAFTEREKLLQAEIEHLRQRLQYYRQVIEATKALVRDSSRGLKQLQDSTFKMRREERRIKKEWEAYVRSKEATRNVTTFF